MTSSSAKTFLSPGRACSSFVGPGSGCGPASGFRDVRPVMEPLFLGAFFRGGSNDASGTSVLWRSSSTPPCMLNHYVWVGETRAHETAAMNLSNTVSLGGAFALDDAVGLFASAGRRSC